MVHVRPEIVKVSDALADLSNCDTTGGPGTAKNRFKLFHSALFRMWGLDKLGAV